VCGGGVLLLKAIWCIRFFQTEGFTLPTFKYSQISMNNTSNI
jgi:hypothetical protein